MWRLVSDYCGAQFSGNSLHMRQFRREQSSSRSMSDCLCILDRTLLVTVQYGRPATVLSPRPPQGVHSASGTRAISGRRASLHFYISRPLGGGTEEHHDQECVTHRPGTWQQRPIWGAQVRGHNHISWRQIPPTRHGPPDSGGCHPLLSGAPRSVGGSLAAVGGHGRQHS